ncbi:MAG: hypothetical protein ACKO2G_05460 [Verrucomicrobiales bacterium]
MKISTCLRRAGAALAALAATLVLPSCFEAYNTVKVSKDGSGTVENKIVMSAEMAGMMNAAAAQEGGDAPKNPLLDEEKLKAEATKMGEGVEFVSAKELKFDDGRMGVVATYKFADVTKITVSPGSGGPGDEGGEEPVNKDKQIQFGFAKDDKPVLTVKMPKKDAKKEEAGEPADAGEPAEAGEDADAGEPAEAGEDAQAMAMMTQMFQGMKIGMTVEVDGKVSESTATNIKDSTVTLMEIDFGKMMANPDFAKKMKSPDQMEDFAKFAEMAKEFGATIEPKDEISVTFE